jgi:DNA-binding GntR family transcriptional regulator
MILRNNDEYLYLQIAESIRRDIENGIYHTGDALPPIRDITTTWHCTIGTVQREIS